jgi:methylisocitrate lyase
MVDRIKAAVDARTDPSFMIMARTDALAIEGVNSALDRAHSYVEAGADAIFPEAIADLSTYKQFSSKIQSPILANITEFGLTPLFTVDDLGKSGVSMVLYPLSAFRAMNKAAEKTFESIRKNGTQSAVIQDMQTREELYDRINYYEYESALDKYAQKED